MIEELQERFRDQLVKIARERLERALQAVNTEGGADLVKTEMHALAGESAILAFACITEPARVGEEAAKRWILGDTAAQAECARALDTLVASVDDLQNG